MEFDYRTSGLKPDAKKRLEQILKLAVGYSIVRYQNKNCGVIRTDYNNGRSQKIFAQELGGKNFISLNYYLTQKGERLKPCEMPEKKVIDFLNSYQIL
jgi:peptide-methionine (S)-S-oxide reductase